MRRRRLPDSPSVRMAALALAGALVAAACSGSDDAADPPPTDGSGATAAPTAPGTEPAATDAPPPATDASEATTTVPAPSSDADLPTRAPDQVEPAPPTTLAGPLPEPDVALFQVGVFDSPVDAAVRPLDPRLFVVEQGGRVVAIDDESAVVVLDIADVPTTFSSGGEQGLLGLAFHPDADRAYIDFTNGDGFTVVAEFLVDPTTAVFDTASYREIAQIEQPFANHNGGDVEFGPDGMLYIATGDGGAGADPQRTARDLSSPLGKILRIDPTPEADAEPGVPADNPFVDTAGADPRIWAYGLRNPWKFDFDDLTGDLWIADVGQGEIEEIDLAPATDGTGAGRGLDFGWSAFEGPNRFNEDEPETPHLPPVFSYDHSAGDCSVSGGVVARNSSYDDLNGWYVFGDFCTGRTWALDTTSVGVELDDTGGGTVVGTPRVVELPDVESVTGFVAGPDGDVYALSLQGPLYRLEPG